MMTMMISAGIGALVVILAIVALGTIHNLKEANATILGRLTDSTRENERLKTVNAENEKELLTIRPFIHRLAAGGIHVTLSDDQLQTIAKLVASGIESPRTTTFN
jgi:hypothetical protein